MDPSLPPTWFPFGIIGLTLTLLHWRKHTQYNNLCGQVTGQRAAWKNKYQVISTLTQSLQPLKENLFRHTEKEKGKPISYPGLNWLCTADQNHKHLYSIQTHSYSVIILPLVKGEKYTPQPFALTGDKLLCKLQMVNQETGFSGKYWQRPRNNVLQL